MMLFFFLNIYVTKMTLAVFLNIEGAFDRVSVDTIVRILDHKGTNPIILRWVRNLLTFRFVRASVLGCCSHYSWLFTGESSVSSSVELCCGFFALWSQRP